MQTALSPSASASIKIVTTDDPQGQKFVEKCRAHYNKARLDPDRAQRLNESAEFSEALVKLIAEHSQTDRFKEEVVASSAVYPKTYTGPKEIAVQVATVAALFRLNPMDAHKYIKHVLPTLVSPLDMGVGAEGNFAFPSPFALAAQMFPEVTDPKDQICRLTTLVLDKLEQSLKPKWKNWRKGEIVLGRYELHARTVQAFERLHQEQSGDIWIFPAQLGMLHRGESDNRALETLLPEEFPLGAFLVCACTLVHPERLSDPSELDMNCGDRFAPEADGVFSRSCFLYFFGWIDGQARFDTRDLSFVVDCFGLASGFFPRRK